MESLAVRRTKILIIFIFRMKEKKKKKNEATKLSWKLIQC